MARTGLDMARVAALVMLAVGRSVADQHHLFTSSISTPHLFALEFDDQTNSLVNIANMTAHDGHPWMSFSYDKSTVYAGERAGFASYSVVNSTALSFSNSIALPESCQGESTEGSGSPYVLAELRQPFAVFGASSSSCGAVMSVDIAGNLKTVLQSFKFKDGSSVKGMALDPDNKYLFSADEQGNGIWSHSITAEGTVTPITFTASAAGNKGPRRLVAHPDGKYLYAVMGGSNTVAVYAINNGPGSSKSPLTYTGLSYSLLPRGATNSLYKADEVLLSADANVLYASTRYVEAPKVEPKKPIPTSAPTPDDDDDDDKRWGNNKKFASTSSQPGYITAILLTALGEAETPLERRTVGAGFPIRPLFQLATTTSGGLSNSVSPAPWGNDFFALADSEVGLIEVWKLDNLQKTNYSGPLGEGAATASKGGWTNKVWSSSGALVFKDPVVQEATPAPVQTSKPKQTTTAQPKSWGGKGDPWNQSGRGTGDAGRDSNSDGGEDWRGAGKGDRDWSGGRGGRDWGGDSEDGRGFDDEERKRFMGNSRVSWMAQNIKSDSSIANVQVFRRQTPAQTPAVTARVVASWKAPAIATVGRHLTEQETLEAQMNPTAVRLAALRKTRESKAKKVPSRKLVAPPGPTLAPEAGGNAEEVVTAPANASQAVVMTEAEERQAVEKRQGCCANALWFD